MKELVVPFKVYADFESLLKEVQSNDRNNNTSHTGKYQYQKHILIASKKVINLICKTFFDGMEAG